MAVKAKYTSKDGAFVVGVPARDLDEDEYAALDTEQKRTVRSSGLYDVKGDEPARNAPVKGGT